MRTILFMIACTALCVMMVVGIFDSTTPVSAGEMTGNQARECFYRSYRCESSQKYADAIAALAELPRGYLVELRLGWLHYLKKDYASAGQHYRAAIHASPSSIEARLGLMFPLLAQQRYADVEVTARQIIALDGHHYLANLRLACSLRMQRKYAPACTVTRRMLLLYPTDVSLLLEKGLDLVALQQHEEARSVFNTVLTLDPANATATAQLAKL